MSKVVVLMGSKADLEWSNRMVNTLRKFDIPAVCHIASAHKVPLQCYDLIKTYEKQGVVFITVVGRSNALSGFTDAQTHCPVIACPPVGDAYGGADVFSSLRMPSGVAPMVILDPENAALAAAKIIGLANDNVGAKIIAFQEAHRKTLIDDNNALNN